MAPPSQVKGCPPNRVNSTRFEALGVTEDRRAADPDTQPTAGFKAIMREAAETRSYAAALSVLIWPLSLDWASRALKPLPDNFVHCQVVHRGSPGGLA
jgi:thiaminase (transcriptional activator TenA)